MSTMIWIAGGLALLLLAYLLIAMLWPEKLQ